MGQFEFTNNFKRLQEAFRAWLKLSTERLELVPSLREPVSAALLSGGKRVRPVLCLAAAEAHGIALDEVRPFALALEFLHTSSLIHDDLPALDNDDFRRGEPTTHKRFGEAAAVLAGDYLLVESFGVLATANPAVAGRWLGVLAAAARDLCDGQTLDLAIGGKLPNVTLHPDAQMLETVCRKKTAALFRAALSGPAYLLPGPDADAAASRMAEFGEQLGLLFQLTDDLLDEAQDTAPGGAGEVSFVVLYGRKETEKRADTLVESTLKLLPDSKNFEFLREFTVRVRARQE